MHNCFNLTTGFGVNEWDIVIFGNRPPWLNPKLPGLYDSQSIVLKRMFNSSSCRIWLRTFAFSNNIDQKGVEAVRVDLVAAAVNHSLEVFDTATLTAEFFGKRYETWRYPSIDGMHVTEAVVADAWLREFARLANEG